MVAGVPCMCMTTTPTPFSEQMPSISGLDNPVTSLTTSAPTAIAAAATSGFDVSIETGTPRPDKPATTGTTRCNSSAAVIPVDPGRVDSPPTSTRSAPCS